jgi:hypothetical protein
MLQRPVRLPLAWRVRQVHLGAERTVCDWIRPTTKIPRRKTNVGAGFDPAPDSDVRTRAPGRLLICPTESLVDKYVLYDSSRTQNNLSVRHIGGSTQHLTCHRNPKVHRGQYIGDGTQYLVRSRTRLRFLTPIHGRQYAQSLSVAHTLENSLVQQHVHCTGKFAKML